MTAPSRRTRRRDAGLVALLLMLAAPARSAAAAPFNFLEALTTGPDGRLWFADHPATLGAIAADTIRRFAVPGAGIVRAIAPGPDGNVWFTYDGPFQAPAGDGDAVGRITPTGAVTLFRAGLTPASRPAAIAVGPDGALWVAEAGDLSGPPGAPRIGRVTPAGSITEFATGPAGAPAVADLTAGPSGDVWFTAGRRVARITPAGQITSYRVPVALGVSQQLGGITPGPDGNLWFAATSEIGQVTPSGAVTMFRRGVAPGGYSDWTYKIVAGPGGLWFNTNSDGVGRIDVHGGVVHFRRGLTGNVGVDVARGPDGLIRAVDLGLGGSQIIRLGADGRVQSEFPAPPACRVPDVRGFHLDHAAALLENAFCAARAVAPRRRPGTADVVVLAERPAPGGVLRYRGAVSLILGPAPRYPRGCARPPFARTLVASGRLRVYERDGDVPGGEPDDTRQVIYACAGGPLRRVFAGGGTLLGADTALGVTGAAALVAYAEASGDHYGHDSLVLHVFDAAAGRDRLAVTIFDAEGPAPELAGLAVGPGGALAWILDTPPGQTLFVHDAFGTRRLDLAPAITGLAVGVSAVRWSAAGQARAAGFANAPPAPRAARRAARPPPGRGRRAGGGGRGSGRSRRRRGHRGCRPSTRSPRPHRRPRCRPAPRPR